MLRLCSVLTLWSVAMFGAPPATASPTSTASTLTPSTGVASSTVPTPTDVKVPVTGTASAGDPTTLDGPAPVGGPGLAGSGVLAQVPAGVPQPPSMAAAAYLLADLSTGEILVAKAPHARHLPASTLKALTALTVMPHLDPAAVITAEPADLVEGSRVGILPGLTYTVHELLQGMLMSSGNDAATALARVAGGPDGVAGTVAAMQAEADRLGARDTVVRTPSGLDATGQVTSAYDLALIAREALQNPSFRALVATKRTRFPGKPVTAATETSSGTTRPSTTATPTGDGTPAGAGEPDRETFQIQNHNTLLYNYDGAIGVKNGYTVAARWTIVGAAERGGRSYVVTALARSDRSWRPTAALLDWAFAHGSQVTPVGRLVAPGELERAEARSAPTTVTAVAAGEHTQAVALTRTPADRWIGVAGLAAAVLLVAAMGVRSRRPRGRRRSGGPSSHR